MTEQNQMVMTMDDTEQNESNTKKYLTFFIENQLYAIASEQVIEIIRMQAITYIPKLPSFVKGVINLRGKIVPLIDVRSKFGKEEVPYDERTSIIVTDINDLGVGLIVDTVNDVSDISEDDLSPSPQIAQGKSSGFVSRIAHIGENVIMMLDATRLLGDKKAEAAQEEEQAQAQ